MSQLLQNPPTSILAKALADTGIAVLLTSWDKVEATAKDDSNWPIYVANAADKPDNQIAILATSGIKQAREMFTGATCDLEGFQIRVQSHNYYWADYKSREIYKKLMETIDETTVEVDDNSYILHTVIVDSPPLSLGRNVPESHRYAFTINGTMSISIKPTE